MCVAMPATSLISRYGLDTGNSVNHLALDHGSIAADSSRMTVEQNQLRVAWSRRMIDLSQKLRDYRNKRPCLIIKPPNYRQLVVRPIPDGKPGGLTPDLADFYSHVVAPAPFGWRVKMPHETYHDDDVVFVVSRSAAPEAIGHATMLHVDYTLEARRAYQVESATGKVSPCATPLAATELLQKAQADDVIVVALTRFNQATIRKYTGLRLLPVDIDMLTAS